MTDSKTAPGTAPGTGASGTDDQASSFTELDQALSDLAKAAVPLVHQVVEVLQTNMDPVSAAAKDLLKTAGQHAEPLLNAGARLASTGVRQIGTLGKSVQPVSSPPPAKPAAGTTARPAARPAGTTARPPAASPQASRRK